MCLFVFFKQKTAYEVRISDWSSDVCSSDLGIGRSVHDRRGTGLCGLRLAPERNAGCRCGARSLYPCAGGLIMLLLAFALAYLGMTLLCLTMNRHRGALLRADTRLPGPAILRSLDRTSVVSGKSVSVRVDLGGRRIIKTKNTQNKSHNTTVIKKN